MQQIKEQPSFLVTGGTGFIGSHVVEDLLRRQFRVRCIVRPGRTALGWIADLPCEVIHASLLDSQSLKSAIADVDYIIHIAGVTKAKKREQYFAGNTAPLPTILEEATLSPRLKKFCYISSIAAVGPSPTRQPIAEDYVGNPITPYGEAKKASEKICHSYFDKLPVVIIRPPAVYGPRDIDFLEVFKMTKNRLDPRVGHVEGFTSIIHAEDLARSIVDATIAEGNRSQTYFVSDSVIHPTAELTAIIAKLLGKKPLVVHLPVWLYYTIAALSQASAIFSKKPSILNLSRAKDFMQPYWICSSAKIEKEIGFAPKYSLEAGLAMTAQWYRDRGWI